VSRSQARAAAPAACAEEGARLTAGFLPIDSATRPERAANGNPRREIDVFERQLFGVLVVDAKARRTVAPPCPECGRRGYHVKVCRRRSLLDAGARAVDELDLRWQYLARIVFSQGVRLSDSQRSAPFKGRSIMR